jgi:N-acetylglutamate synthase/N-acetylornithine aminotransferase
MPEKVRLLRRSRRREHIRVFSCHVDVARSELLKTSVVDREANWAWVVSPVNAGKQERVSAHAVGFVRKSRLTGATRPI